MLYLRKILCAALAITMMLAGTSCGGFGDILFGDDTTAAPEIHTEPAENTDPEPGEVETPEEKTTEEETTEEETTEEETTEEKTTEEETTQHVHTEEVLVEVTPSCTETGLTEGKHCSVCNTVLVEQEIVPAKGHTEVIDSAVEAKCTETGLTEGKHCSVCNQVLMAQKVVPAKGHTAGEWVVDREPEAGIEGSKHTTCIVCGAVYEEPIEMLYSQGLAYIANGDGTCSVSGIGNCTDKNVFIPKTYNGMTVTEIESYAFRGCQELISVVIPDGVTEIGSRAFEGCSNLISAQISASVTDTSIWTFANCPSLLSITVDPANAFYCSLDGILYDKNITNLICCPGGRTEIAIPDSVTEIYYGSFVGCSNLTCISLPANLIDIGNYAFRGCSNLTTLTIPDKVTWVGTGAFSGCDKLVVEENGVRYVDKWVVDCDSSVTDVVLRESTQGIAFEAFTYCHNLKTISIPSGISDVTKHMFSDSSQVFVKDKGIIYVDKWVVNSDQTVSEIVLRDDTVGIGSLAFSHNDKIVSVVIPDSVMHIGPEAFYGCEKLTFIKIGNGVTSIGSYAFSGCWNLSSVVIGSNVTSIGDRAFSNCHNLTSINIPDSVTSIGARAFENCSSLTDIYYTGTQAEWESITKGSYWDRKTGSYTVHFDYTPET